MISVLRVFAMISIAYVTGKLIAKIKLPAILGWLICGMVFGPYLVGIVSEDILGALTYKIFIKVFECFAGVMIGSEILFKQLKEFGSQITVITLFQSLGTFALVTGVFALTFYFVKLPIYPSFIFGGIALATAPAPALSIVNEFKTEGPLTRTLIPMAAMDDVIGVIVFFSVISVISAVFGQGSVSALDIILMILLPFVIGIPLGVCSGLIMRKIKKAPISLCIMILGLGLCVSAGIVCDRYIFKTFALNYLLIGMAFSAACVNIVPKEKIQAVLKEYNPLLSLSLIIVIVNLGMPLDYRLIAGAGMYTAIYIIVRAAGKIGGAAMGGLVCDAELPIKKYLGLTLLPHSGVSLIFTGIAVSTLSAFDTDSARLIQGTIAAAAIINEIIAVILAKQAFKWAGELYKAK